MNGRIFLAFFCLLALCTACEPDGVSSGATESSGFVPAGYELVWNDEFDGGPLPDADKWGYQTGGYGWTAKELQNYLEADPDNVGVENGLLRITARAEKVERNNFTSTRLVSKRKADFTRGYFEIRAKFPKGEGLRSAFWMVGDTVTQMGWPAAGEIDLVEHYGKFPTVVNAAVQTKNNSWIAKNQLGGSVIVKQIEEEFHVYGCTWTEDRLEFTVDGQTYWTYDAPPGAGKKGFPFRWPYYMVANLSIGGIRGPIGAVKPEVLPASFYLDYVRVYQRE
ncbi:MAG: glycoside hydrolase family 16 protein [Bacteroidota bacterium]